MTALRFVRGAVFLLEGPNVPLWFWIAIAAVVIMAMAGVAIFGYALAKMIERIMHL